MNRKWRTIFVGLIPDEFVAASRASRELWNSASKTSHLITKEIVGACLPIIGALLVVLLFPVARSIMLDPAVVDGFLSFAAATLGFIIAVMIFTGFRPPPNLSLSSMKLFRDKLYYLFFSEILTFAIFTLLLIILFAQRALLSDPAYTDLAGYVGVFCLALGCLGLLRLVLLPFSIFEMHSVSVNSAIVEKQREIDNQIREERGLLQDYSRSIDE